MKKSSQKQIRVMIEATAYEAKSLAEHYRKDRKYEVIDRSKPYPCGKNHVRIRLRVVKKTQLGYQHKGGLSSKGKNNRNYERQRLNIQELMKKPY